MPNAAREINQGKRVVHDLVRPWYRSGHNVVADNFFCSIPLADELLEKNLTLLGTLRKNKPEIPLEMLPCMDRAEYSSIFGFDGKITIVSYVPKPNHAVLDLSTTHHDMQTEGEKQKPVIITHYNQTKSGMDNLDHSAGLFSVKRKTRRWPLVLFFNMLDVGAIASFVIWIANYPYWENLRRAIGEDDSW